MKTNACVFIFIRKVNAIVSFDETLPCLQRAEEGDMAGATTAEDSALPTCGGPQKHEKHCEEGRHPNLSNRRRRRIRA